MRRKLAAGNWKMNGSDAALKMIAELAKSSAYSSCDIVICPPAVLLAKAAELSTDGPVDIGAQDCHAEEKGAYTGDCSARMIADAGASYVIVGHSERRTAYGETDIQVAAKATAAQNAGLTPIICIGESLAERDAGEALAVISSQLADSVPHHVDCSKLVVAYEPIWAIGTGRIPTLEQITEVHTALRAQLMERFGIGGDGIRLLYGGSVKPSNAADIFGLNNVDGALVGGASLKVEDFAPIISALQAST